MISRDARKNQIKQIWHQQLWRKINQMMRRKRSMKQRICQQLNMQKLWNLRMIKRKQKRRKRKKSSHSQLRKPLRHQEQRVQPLQVNKRRHQSLNRQQIKAGNQQRKIKLQHQWQYQWNILLRSRRKSKFPQTLLLARNQAENPQIKENLQLLRKLNSLYQ